MSTAEKLLAIRKKCVKANPLKKKHVSCREHHLMGFKNRPKRERICIFCGYCEADYHFSLGSILLAVLAANPANRTRVTVESSGQFCNTVTRILGPFWNLRQDSLDAQPPETINFLYDLLRE